MKKNFNTIVIIDSIWDRNNIFKSTEENDDIIDINKSEENNNESKQIADIELHSDHQPEHISSKDNSDVVLLYTNKFRSNKKKKNN